MRLTASLALVRSGFQEQIVESISMNAPPILVKTVVCVVTESTALLVLVRVIRELSANLSLIFVYLHLASMEDLVPVLQPALFVIVRQDFRVCGVKPTSSMNAVPIPVKMERLVLMLSIPSLVFVVRAFPVPCAKPTSMNALPILV
jgi:hypothetical protein